MMHALLTDSVNKVNISQLSWDLSLNRLGLFTANAHQAKLCVAGQQAVQLQAACASVPAYGTHRLIAAFKKEVSLQ